MIPVSLFFRSDDITKIISCFFCARIGCQFGIHFSRGARVSDEVEYKRLVKDFCATFRSAIRHGFRTTSRLNSTHPCGKSLHAEIQ